MRMIKLGLVAILPLAVAACPPAERVDDPAVVPPTEEPAPVPPAAAQQTELLEVGGSGVTGQISATPREDETEIMVMVRNAPPDASLNAYLLSGTCESPGVEISGLDGISTDATGQGSSTSTVGHAPHQIMDGNHIVAVYGPDADREQDRPIACNVLPQHTQATM